MVISNVELREGGGGNPEVLAELAETKRGVAAVDRREKGAGKERGLRHCMQCMYIGIALFAGTPKLFLIKCKWTSSDMFLPQ